MIPYAAPIAALALAGIVGLSYVKGRSDGREIAAAQAAREERVAQVAGAAAAASAAEAISRLEVKHVVNRRILETQVREVPVYRDCIAPDDSVRRVNSTLAGPDDSASAGGVPPAGPAQ